MRKKLGYLTTGEFASLCNVTKHTLFHYDDIDLLKPKACNEKGYRLYSYEQLSLFYFISVMKDLGMPLAKIKYYLDNRTPKQIESIFVDKIDNIDNEINRLKKHKEMLQTRIGRIRASYEIDYDAFNIEYHNKEYYILSKNLNSSNYYEDVYKIIKDNFSEYIYQSEINDSIYLLLDIHKTENGYELGHEHFLQLVDENTNSSSLHIKEEGIFLVGYHKGYYATIESTYEKMYKYINDNNFEVGKNSYVKEIFNELTCADKNDYLIKIVIEVKSKNL